MRTSVGGRLAAALLVGACATGLSVGAAAAQGAGDCASAGADPLVADAQVSCDASQGWRLSAWNGESGDGIVRVEHADPTWTTEFEGPFCAAGVAAATPDDLLAQGMPRALADAWGFPATACDPTALHRTGSDAARLLWIALALLAGGATLLSAASRPDGLAQPSGRSSRARRRA